MHYLLYDYMLFIDLQKIYLFYYRRRMEPEQKKKKWVKKETQNLNTSIVNKREA